jgi:hypothetical protein
MANPSNRRVCRLHELTVYDTETGGGRAFRYGDIVEMTPALEEALGDYLEKFEPVEPEASASQTDPDVPAVTHEE